jgi:hypothetical protein
MNMVFSTCKNLSSKFFDLDIENPLSRGTLAKIDPPRIGLRFTCCRRNTGGLDPFKISGVGTNLRLLFMFFRDQKKQREENLRALLS